MKLTSTSKPVRIFLYALPSLLVWFLVLMVYWPGLMSHDSVVQWAEVVSGNFTDYHPAFHTLLELVASRLIGGSPAGVAVAQIFGLSLVAGWGISTFQDMGLKKWLCWACAVIFAIFPVNFVLVNTLWKDVPFSISMLALSVIFLKIYLSKGQWLKGARLGFLGLVLACVALFRHNGIAIVLLCGLTLLFIYPKSAKLFLTSLMVFAVVFFGVTKVLFPVLKVKPATDFKFGIFSYYLAAHLSSDTKFSDTELQFMDKIMPVSEDWYYSCKVNQSLILSADGKAAANLAFLESNKLEFFSLFFRANLRNPSAALNHLRCTTAYIWNPKAPLGGRYPIRTKPEIWWVSSNPLGITSNSLLPVLVKPVTNFIKLTETFFWCPAMYLYAFLLMIGVILIKTRKFTFLLPFFPALFNMLILFFVTPSQEFRYQYPLVLSVSFLWPLLILAFEKKFQKSSAS